MGTYALAYRTIQHFSIYFQDVCPNNSEFGHQHRGGITAFQGAAAHNQVPIPEDGNRVVAG